MTAFPQLKTAQQLIDEGVIPPAVSERTLRALAKTHNVGRKMGRFVVFTPEDVLELVHRLPCLSNSSRAKARETGSYGGLSEDAKYLKAQALITAGRRTKSASGAKRNSSTLQSTAKVVSIRSRTQP